MQNEKDFQDIIFNARKLPFTESEKEQLMEDLENTEINQNTALSRAILKGQYRMSIALLNRIMRLKKKNDKKNPQGYKITKAELLVLLLLLQMCDSSNRIRNFSYSKDIKPLKDTNGEQIIARSTLYYALDGLAEKNIISLEKQEDGSTTLAIPANKINKKDAYITLQTEYLLHDSQEYVKFRNMTLAAMKIYLLSLSRTYRGKDTAGRNIITGTVNLRVAELKDKLGVKQNRSLQKYIHHLEKAFGKITFLSGNGKETFQKGSLSIVNNNNHHCFAKRVQLSKNQLNSFRRHFDQVIDYYKIDKGVIKYYEQSRNLIYMILTEKNELDTEKVFAYIISKYRLLGSVDVLTTIEIIRQLALI